MKTTLALLIASTALTASIAGPVWSAVEARAVNEARPIASLVAGPDAQPVILASNDDDDDDDDHNRRRSGHGHDDDDDDDDDDDGGSARANPAPAGAVAPPANGLFGNGAAPKVQVN
ncbi:hypothetical protein LL06_21895 [Hoeflea sp. BAL378]|uniref:hypothetical protein n=1 Tax=Hoeflea sp. BAL378 TaxID=1547437 RepID=UPI0005136AB6|nr:hypothetical protein [Hoeflea sp. BAL378]KGF67503.1 hypothetical protein LL06_21895 [Hoeflea sp. BAL378]